MIQERPEGLVFSVVFVRHYLVSVSNGHESNTDKHGAATPPDRIAELIADGRSLEEVVAADPTGGGEEAAVWVGFVYEELKGRVPVGR